MSPDTDYSAERSDHVVTGSAIGAVSKVAVTALLCVVLGACAAWRQPPPGSVDWQNHRNALLNLDAWKLKGRMALKAGDDGVNGSVTWSQDPAGLDFRFRGPLGVGGFRIHGNDLLLTLETSKGEVMELEDAVVPLENQMQIVVPVRSMRYWILGIPDPAGPADETVGESGLLTRLDQGGWTVMYTSYRAVDGTEMPRKLTIENHAVRIKLAVDRWTLPQTT